MTTPNPRGMIRDTFWDRLALAKACATAHWSYDPKLASKGESRKRKQAALVASL